MGDRVPTLLDQLTLDEKCTLVSGRDMWHGGEVPRLGLRGLKVTDGPNGARGSLFVGTTSACLPCGTALASTWDTPLVEELGGLLAQETRSKGCDLLLAPTVNIHRHPLAGRNFECYSEDPFLSARMAVAFITGVQRGGVGATVKHLVANDSEFERHTISSEVPERALREIYLPPFEAAVVEARTMSVMTAYNRLGGVYCGEHPELMRILHDEWTFDGFVISDWWSIHSTEGTAHHGVDLEMPGPPRHFGPALAAAVRDGAVAESEVDAKVVRLLGVMERLGALDRAEHLADASVDLPEHRQLLLRAARQAVVLLSNDDVDGRPALPLDPDTLRRLAVIGPNADTAVVQGGGSAGVTPHHEVTVLDALRERLGDSVELVHEPGVDAWRNLPPVDARWLTPVPLVGAGDMPRRGVSVEYFTNRELEGEPAVCAYASGMRLNWLGDPVPGITGGDFSMRASATFTAPVDGPFTFGLVAGGRGRLLLDGECIADMWDQWRPGTAFFGLGSEEARHRVELTAGTRHELVVELSCVAGVPAAAVLVGGLPAVDDDGIERAVAAARDADAAVVVVGLNLDWETEGEDRSSFQLPGRQDELVAAVAAANPRTIVLVNAGSPVAMDWADDTQSAPPAIAQMWYLGQESGRAVAELLVGDHSPSGRLPTTYPARLEDCPAYVNYPGENGRVCYGEGIFVGYRWWDRVDREPRFCFGHGLGYGRVDLGPPTVDTEEIHPDGSVTVSVAATNTGTRPTAEIIQVYVTDDRSRLVRPARELKGFARVELAPGQSTTATVTLDERAFSYWDDAVHRWVCEPGTFTVAVGRSSRDLTGTVAITRPE